jgi:hypothetical protein
VNQSDIIAAVRAGRAEFALAPLQTGPLTFRVFADALKIDGVRIAVSDDTTREVARMLGFHSTTPKIEDLIFQAAKHRAIPVTFTENRNAWETIRAHSHAIESQLPKNRAPDDICATVGKSWVDLAKPSGSKAVNYGWHGGPIAKSNAVTPGLKVIQPVSTFHNRSHADYSQTLRLVDRIVLVDGVSRDLETILRDPILGKLIAHDAPFATMPTATPVMDPNEPLGVRCVKLARFEAARQNPPTAGMVAEYFKPCERNGKPLGVTQGNHCAAFVSWCAVQCQAAGEVVPHRPRAAAKELMRDAVSARAWHPKSEVIDGIWRPSSGDVAIYDRFDPNNPHSQPWFGHADRVIDVEGDSFTNIGANEVAHWSGRGMTREQSTPFSHPKLMGFIAYPTPPAQPDPAPPTHLLTDGERDRLMGLVALTADQAEAEFFDDWRRD